MRLAYNGETVVAGSRVDPRTEQMIDALGLAEKPGPADLGFQRICRPAAGFWLQAGALGCCICRSA